MRNTIEILFGPASEKVARTEWVKVCGSPAQGGYDTYADTATIRRNGNTVKMWHLHDFRTTQVSQGKAYLSAKNWVEYDLAYARRRTLYFSWNTAPMGGGDTVYRMEQPSGWREIMPGSVADLLRKIAGGAA